MRILRDLIGFLVGTLFGGVALVLLTTNVPQIGKLDVSAEAVSAESTTPTEMQEPKKEIGTADLQEQLPYAVKENAEVSEPEPELVKAEPIKIEPEPAASEVLKEQPVEVTEPETPKIVWQSQETEAQTATKKFNLPTISPAEPKEVTIEPVQDADISVGKKPSSNLPTITDAAPDQVVDVTETVDGKALEHNATEYERKDRPLLGVILLDVGDKGLSIDKLKKLNAPLTIAIDINNRHASARALAYYAAGFEVIAMASDDRNAALNTALNAKQVQAALDVMFTTVPNAIGLLDSLQAGIQKNSRIAKMIVKGFVETGHGLVTYAKGLNSVDREARADGVRAAKVARILDANSENKALMVRYLDRASLDAGRDGAAIVLGTTAQKTVATIAVWLLSSKGQSVSVAPASAVLLGR